MKTLVRILLLLAVLTAMLAAPCAVTADSLWDTARIGLLVSLEGKGGCRSAEVPARLVTGDLGEVTLSWTLSLIGLCEDANNPLPNRAVLGTGLLAECEQWGRASFSLTYTEQYQWSANITPIRIRF